MGEHPSRQELYRIGDDRWEQGWRYGLRAAIDKALEGKPDGTELQIKEIWVLKRGDTSFHDYRVVL